MSDHTSIEWTDATWNPLRGCSRVSQGCRNCYAEKVAARFSGSGQPYEGLVNKHGAWNGTIKLVGSALDQPLRWRRPRRIFVNSMSDLFHEVVPDEFIDQVMAVMAYAKHHTFQVLTKRPERMREYFAVMDGSSYDFQDRWDFARRWLLRLPLFQGRAAHKTMGAREYIGIAMAHQRWPLPNVWLGVSVEDQATADERIPLLLQTPAAVRWISAEPLLGPVDLKGYLDDLSVIPQALRRSTGDWVAQGIDWVVVGGESGPGARPMHPEWARSLRDQCQDAGVPFLFKQWGEWMEAEHACNHLGEDDRRVQNLRGSDGDRMIARDGEIYYRLGKKVAGRELDGRTWDEYPKERSHD